MTGSIAWIHVGDLHARAGDGWLGVRRLEEVVAGLRRHSVRADFLFLPGDNADDGTADQYTGIGTVLAGSPLPWRAIAGDHDFAGGDLDAYREAIAIGNRPEQESVAGHRLIFLDIVSAGEGGPDFRLTMHDRDRIARDFAEGAAAGEVPLVFMHAYPGDLAADGDTVATMFADAGVVFVDTGHTHYNELLNDGRVIYGATRSSAQIEEDDGRAGIATVCVHDRCPSWRFRPLDEPWPAIQIVAPCDLRLVTRPADPRQVPRPGPVEIVARAFGDVSAPALTSDDGAERPMRSDADGLWRGDVVAESPGLHRVTVRAGAASDAIDLLVRPGDNVPKRRQPVALGHAAHAIGAWPRAGILGTQLGPNRNGKDW